ncbi:hypothetical protein M2283_006929 [Streptomyces pseudovenezuelae]|uniref:Transposase n=1 Tax=Streptomyces pseudovenezuelae TaxID=67350 RepID=A0ABT6LTE7_9ACTN|nr:hypothetical protein [Streptomyces pseudovenezuelae]
MNGFGKLRRCTEKRSRVVAFYLYLSEAKAGFDIGTMMANM